MKKNIVYIALILAGVLLIVLGLRTDKQGSFQKKTVFLMDTYCTIQVQDGKNAPGCIDKAFERMKEIDTAYNALNEKSALYAFNNSNVPITDKEVVDLLRTAVSISSNSNVSFDVTVYPLMKLWGFYESAPRLPDKKAVEQNLKYVGYKKLVINNDSVAKLNEKTGIDLGGIAKGYAIKEAVRVLREQGITSSLIDAGGDIFALGSKKGKQWRVGVRNPRGERIVGVLDVSDRAVVTSGDYERYFEEGGNRYHHLLDPATGYPADRVISVTVVALDPVAADAWATALFVMGADAGLKLVETMPDMEAVFILKDEKILHSSGLSNCFKEIKDL